MPDLPVVGGIRVKVNGSRWSHLAYLGNAGTLCGRVSHGQFAVTEPKPLCRQCQAALKRAS